MTEALSKEKLVELEAKHPVVMSKREKLLHWASLIRAHKSRHGALWLLHNLEDWSPYMLENPEIVFGSRTGEHFANTAFGVAAADEQFKAAGLVGSAPAHIMKFFELSRADLHEFACNCGGDISNEEQARRVEHLANGGGGPRLNPYQRSYHGLRAPLRFSDGS